MATIRVQTRFAQCFERNSRDGHRLWQSVDLQIQSRRVRFAIGLIAAKRLTYSFRVCSRARFPCVTVFEGILLLRMYGRQRCFSVDHNYFRYCYHQRMKPNDEVSELPHPCSWRSARTRVKHTNIILGLLLIGLECISCESRSSALHIVHHYT